MAKILDRLNWFLETVMALLLGVMLVMVFGNVFLRYVFNTGISVSEELARWAFVWMTFLGAVVALKDNAHLGVDMFVKLMPKAGQKACLLLTYFMELGLILLMVVGAWKLTIINLHVSAPTTRWPVALFYVVGVIFGVLAVAVVLSKLMLVLRGQMPLRGTGGGRPMEPPRTA